MFDSIAAEKICKQMTYSFIIVTPVKDDSTQSASIALIFFKCFEMAKAKRN